MLLSESGQLRPSIFAEMSALAVATGSINLGQGFPDEDGPQEVLDAARKAISDGMNQYPPGRGMPVLREAIAAHQSRFYELTWNPDTEAALTADMDIGLMPLDDSLWSLGKCSYKMLLYMACGIPVVATDLGMNRDILGMREVGLGVRTPQDWGDALETLMCDDALRQRMGSEGRNLVVERFSLPIVANQWHQVLSRLPTR